MDMQGYIDNLKFQLTGGLLDLELDDATLTKIMNISFFSLYLAYTRFLYKNDIYTFFHK